MNEAAIKQTVEVPGYSGRAIAVKQGELIRVTDVLGMQVGDVFAISTEDHFEYLNVGCTRSALQKLFPDVGECFYTTQSRPILTLVEDHSPGIHDMLCAPCDPALFEALGCTEYHANCRDNYLEASAEAGISHRVVPDPVNIFQNTPLSPEGAMIDGDMPTKAGDYLVFRAEMDLIFVLTACSCDVGLNNFNGGKSTPLRIELLGA